MERNLPLLLAASTLLVAGACQGRESATEQHSTPQVTRDELAPHDREASSAADTVGPDTVAETAVGVPVRETVPCTVERLIDGDTIECRGSGSVRLIGMDTPERDQRPYGSQATDALDAMLAGARVTLEFDVERRDQYNRLLAYVWADTTLVNLAMVRDGWAVVLTYPPNVQYVDRFTQAQAEARERGAGLWGTGGFDCLPRDRRRGRC
ncbi:MAG: thermonuclease family protein [Gemmatimonadota bacterium]|nr:MAG: thermonuclease family protein [Gemmatimonadota bacterium]